MSRLEPNEADDLSGLYYVRQGSGNPAIMLHGFGATLYSWRHLVSALAARRELWLLDLKGHGRSPSPLDGKYTLQDHAALVYRLIIENDLRQLTLIGHSLGGGIALLVAITLAADGDDRLASLVLMDSIAFPQKVPLFIRICTWPLLGRLALACVPAKLLVRFVLGIAYFNRKKIESQAIEAYAANLRSPERRRALIETAKNLVPDDLKRVLKQYSTIRVPALVIWGQQDRVVPSSVGRELKAALANSRYMVVENCGHMPQEERPEAILGAISDFLGD